MAKDSKNAKSSVTTGTSPLKTRRKKPAGTAAAAATTAKTTVVDTSSDMSDAVLEDTVDDTDITDLMASLASDADSDSTDRTPNPFENVITSGKAKPKVLTDDQVQQLEAGDNVNGNLDDLLEAALAKVNSEKSVRSGNCLFTADERVTSAKPNDKLYHKVFDEVNKLTQEAIQTPVADGLETENGSRQITIDGIWSSEDSRDDYWTQLEELIVNASEGISTEDVICFGAHQSQLVVDKVLDDVDSDNNIIPYYPHDEIAAGTVKPANPSGQGLTGGQLQAQISAPISGHTITYDYYYEDEVGRDLPDWDTAQYKCKIGWTTTPNKTTCYSKRLPGFYPVAGDLYTLIAHIQKGYPWAGAIRHPHDARKSSATLGAWVFALDIDGGFPIEHALELPIYQEWGAAIVESASSTAQLPKYRVIFRCHGSNPVTSSDGVEAVTDLLISRWNTEAEQAITQNKALEKLIKNSSLYSSADSTRDSARYFYGAKDKPAHGVDASKTLPLEILGLAYDHVAASKAQLERLAEKRLSELSKAGDAYTLEQLREALNHLLPRRVPTGKLPKGTVKPPSQHVIFVNIVKAVVNVFGETIGADVVLGDTPLQSDQSRGWDLERAIKWATTYSNPNHKSRLGLGYIFNVCAGNPIKGESTDYMIDPTKGAYLTDGMVSAKLDQLQHTVDNHDDKAVVDAAYDEIQLLKARYSNRFTFHEGRRESKTKPPKKIEKTDLEESAEFLPADTELLPDVSDIKWSDVPEPEDSEGRSFTNRSGTAEISLDDLLQEFSDRTERISLIDLLRTIRLQPRPELIPSRLYPLLKEATTGKMLGGYEKTALIGAGMAVTAAFPNQSVVDADGYPPRNVNFQVTLADSGSAKSMLASMSTTALAVGVRIHDVLDDQYQLMATISTKSGDEYATNRSHLRDWLSQAEQRAFDKQKAAKKEEGEFWSDDFYEDGEPKTNDFGLTRDEYRKLRRAMRGMPINANTDRYTRLLNDSSLAGLRNQAMRLDKLEKIAALGLQPAINGLTANRSIKSLCPPRTLFETIKSGPMVIATDEASKFLSRLLNGNEFGLSLDDFCQLKDRGMLSLCKADVIEEIIRNINLYGSTTWDENGFALMTNKLLISSGGFGRIDFIYLERADDKKEITIETGDEDEYFEGVTSSPTLQYAGILAITHAIIHNLRLTNYVNGKTEFSAVMRLSRKQSKLADIAQDECLEAVNNHGDILYKDLITGAKNKAIKVSQNIKTTAGLVHQLLVAMDFLDEFVEFSESVFDLGIDEWINLLMPFLINPSMKMIDYICDPAMDVAKGGLLKYKDTATNPLDNDFMSLQNIYLDADAIKSEKNPFNLLRAACNVFTMWVHQDNYLGAARLAELYTDKIRPDAFDIALEYSKLVFTGTEELLYFAQRKLDQSYDTKFKELQASKFVIDNSNDDRNRELMVQALQSATQIARKSRKDGTRHLITAKTGVKSRKGRLLKKFPELDELTMIGTFDSIYQQMVSEGHLERVDDTDDGMGKYRFITAHTNDKPLPNVETLKEWASR